MIISDPYLTTYGKLFNKEKIVKDIQKYLISIGRTDLSYEYNTGNEIKLVIITGCTKDEQELAIFNYPIVMKDIKNNTIIAIDLKKYVKDTNDYPINVSDIFKDKSSCEIYINMAIIMSEFLTENFATYRKLYSNIAGAYSSFLTYLIATAIPLSIAEKLDVEIAMNYYANLLLTPGNKYEDYKDSIIARMSNSKFSLPVNRKIIQPVVDKLPLEQIELNITTIIDIIHSVLPPEKSSLINEKIIISLLGNMWYGINASDLLLIGLESMPIWITVIYYALSDNTYKRTKFTNILEKNSKVIEGKELVKALEVHLKTKHNEIF